MIIRQWQQVLRGTKTETRRLVKPGEELEYLIDGLDLGAPKWVVGQTYAVQPGRGKTNLYLCHYLTRQWHSIHDTGLPELGSTIEQSKEVWGKDWRHKITTHPYSWYEARIRLTGIRQEHVQAISEEDAIAEGIFGINCPFCHEQYCGHWDGLRTRPEIAYAVLWNSIHTKPATRWEDNPLVWVLEFELVKEGELCPA